MRIKRHKKYLRKLVRKASRRARRPERVGVMRRGGRRVLVFGARRLPGPSGFPRGPPRTGVYAAGRWAPRTADQASPFPRGRVAAKAGGQEASGQPRFVETPATAPRGSGSRYGGTETRRAVKDGGCRPPRSSPDPATRSGEATPGGGAGASRRTPRRLSATYPAKEATLGAPFRPRRCGAGGRGGHIMRGACARTSGNGARAARAGSRCQVASGQIWSRGGWGRMFAPSLSARSQMHINRPPARYPW